MRVLPRPIRRLFALWVLLATVAAAQAASAPDPEAGRDDDAGEKPAGPTTAVVGIGKDRLSCFIGGGGAEGFANAEAVAPTMHDGQRYVLYDLAGRRDETISIGLPRAEGSREGECSELWRQDLSLDPRAAGKPAVALRLPEGRPDPLPAVLELLPEPLAEHRELVRDFLSKRSVADPEPAISQAIRTDLDGDGTPDYILNAARIGREHARAGDHSLLLVVRGEGEKSRTFIVQDEVEVEDSDYPSTLWTSRVVAVVDVDGDGTAEIITEGGYVYGGGWDVISFDGSGFEYVLFCGCDG